MAKHPWLEQVNCSGVCCRKSMDHTTVPIEKRETGVVVCECGYVMCTAWACLKSPNSVLSPCLTLVPEFGCSSCSSQGSRHRPRRKKMLASPPAGVQFGYIPIWDPSHSHGYVEPHTSHHLWIIPDSVDRLNLHGGSHLYPFQWMKEAQKLC